MRTWAHTPATRTCEAGTLLMFGTVGNQLDQNSDVHFSVVLKAICMVLSAWSVWPCIPKNARRAFGDSPLSLSDPLVILEAGRAHACIF